MKAANRSPAGRPNPAPAKAEVNKLATQGKEKTETKQLQDKTKDNTPVKDKTMDAKQLVLDKPKDGTQGIVKTEAKPLQNTTETRPVVQNKTMDAKQLAQDKPKDGAQGIVKTEAKPVQNTTETRPVVQNKTMDGTPKTQDAAQKKGTVINAEKIPDKKDDKDVVMAVGKDLNGELQLNIKDQVLNDPQVKDKINAGDVIDAVNVKVKNIDQTSVEVNKDNVTNDAAAVKDKTNEQLKESVRETSDKVNESKASPQASSVDDMKQVQEKTQPPNQTEKTTTDKTNLKVKIESDTNDDERETESERENSNHMQNGHKKTDKMTRHRRNETRRKPQDDEESDDVDSGDQLSMDNALVRHLLPHMSPDLLPKAMQPQDKARDYSSNSSEDEHMQHKKISLNVIKESEGEETEEESDDELPAPPPPSMSSSRRHSFHHFPAPPTKSQSKNAEKVRALLQAVEEEELEKISKKLGERTDLVRQHLGLVENRLFEMFGDQEKQTININKFLMGLTATGMRPSDPRLKQTRENLKKLQDNLGSEAVMLDIDYEAFMGIISENLEIIVKAFSAAFVIPDFQGFCKQIEDIYNRCYSNHSGTPAQYIPQLGRFTSKSWGMSVCTVDGQRFSIGDVEDPFTIQSCSKPLTYAIGLAVNGTDYMHNYVGMEPSGRYFNELVLDYNNKPHNPMINSGAIMTAAIIKPDLSAADRFDFMFNVYKRLAGGEYLGFNNSVFLSERECADRNFALAYFMRENKCFPKNHKLQESLDFYFQLCSLEITAESGAVMAATLANGGLNPLTGDPVLTVEAVRNTLTLMHSCGMYNYSGQFSFHVGLPAKSGVSGCVLLVIPNTMGICLWSPPLDSNGNSCRGVQFCMEMVSRFNFHNFDNLRGFSKSKQDPRTAKVESKAQILFDLLFSAAAGDMSAIKRHSLAGTDMLGKDYDGRTALHVATSEGHDEVVEFLLNNCKVDPLPKDRWDRTPLDDAESFDHPKCAKIITDCCKKKGINLPLSYKAYIQLANKANGPLPPVTSS